MYFIDSSCRRGTSTILGTLIFVGILFTAVIPMFLVMRQADTIFEIRKHEQARLDEERSREDVYVYVFSPTPTKPILTLRVENRGDFVVKIEQAWINDSPYPLEDLVVQPLSWVDRQLDDFTAVNDTTYFIKVTTDRGNFFYEESGSIYFNTGGEWEVGSFSIFFVISYPSAGKFNVDVKEESDTGDHVEGSPFVVHKASKETAFDFLFVPTSGTYHVKITRKNEVLYNDCVTIYWPDGPRSATVCT